MFASIIPKRNKEEAKNGSEEDLGIPAKSSSAPSA
jgi:hypothetical protein